MIIKSSSLHSLVLQAMWTLLSSRPSCVSRLQRATWLAQAPWCCHLVRCAARCRRYQTLCLQLCAGTLIACTCLCTEGSRCAASWCHLWCCLAGPCTCTARTNMPCYIMTADGSAGIMAVLQVLVLERLVAGLTRQLLMQRVLGDAQGRADFAAESTRIASAIATQRELIGIDKQSFRSRQRARADAGGHPDDGTAGLGASAQHPALVEYLAAQRSAWKEMENSKQILRQRRRSFKQACYDALLARHALYCSALSAPNAAGPDCECDGHDRHIACRMQSPGIHFTCP